MLYARSVTFELQPGKDQQFRTLFTNEILPVLKRQEGFRDEMMLLHDTHGLGISLWRDKAAIEKYETTVYPEITKKLTPVLKGKPEVDIYEVAESTINIS